MLHIGMCVWLLVHMCQQVMLLSKMRCCFQCVAVCNMTLDLVCCSCTALQLLAPWGYMSVLLQIPLESCNYMSLRQ